MEEGQREIHLEFDEDGQVVMSVKGAAGPSCLSLSKPYSDLFQVEAVTKTEEYDLAEQRARQTQRSVGGV